MCIKEEYVNCNYADADAEAMSQDQIATVAMAIISIEYASLNYSHEILSAIIIMNNETRANINTELIEQSTG